MPITSEWIINKSKNKIYAITHAKSVIRGTSTLDEEMSGLEGSVNGFKTVIDGLSTSIVRNLVDGNNTGAIRHKNAKTDYTMGSYSTASGNSSTASGGYSTASGYSSTASGGYSTASGYSSTASGSFSTASGYSSTASGGYSVSQNYYTDAQGKSQTAIGEYNIPQGTKTARADTDNAFIIGNGISDTSRSNAMTVNWKGDLDLSGGIKVGADINANNKKVTNVATPITKDDATNKEYVDKALVNSTIINDTATGSKYKLGVENGLAFIEQVG